MFAGLDAISVAAEAGNLEVVNLLLKRGAKVNQSGSSALFLAVSHGHLEVAKRLLAAAANVYHQNKDGITALMVAAMRNDVEMTKLLLQHHKRSTTGINLTNNVGLTALNLAKPDSPIEKMLQEHGAKLGRVNVSSLNDAYHLQLEELPAKDCNCIAEKEEHYNKVSCIL